MNPKNKIPRSKKKKGFPVGRSRPSASLRPKTASMRTSGLDPPAIEYLKLLDDPCRGPLVLGPSPGIAGNQILRTRTVIQPGSSSVDGVCYFTPSLFNNLTTDGNSYPLQWASVNTTGQAPLTAYGSVVAGISGSLNYQRGRCLSACLRLRYTGSEMNRAGQVAGILSEDAMLVYGTPTGVTITSFPIPSMYQLTNSWPKIVRLGECDHEVKFLPSNVDCNFVNLGDPGENPNGATSSPLGSTIGIAFFGAPAGSVYFELVSVWEVVPATTGGSGYGNGLMQVMRAPPTRNTLNDIIRTIGNVTDWATSGEPGRTGGTVMSSVSNLLHAGKSIVPIAKALMSLV